jgi:hypothetical protein
MNRDHPLQSANLCGLYARGLCQTSLTSQPDNYFCPFGGAASCPILGCPNLSARERLNHGAALAQSNG